MKRDIKTIEVIKDIKIHDTAINVGDRIKNTTVKTKEQVLDHDNQHDTISPEQYATDKVSETAQRGTESATYTSERVVNNGVKKVKEKYNKSKTKKRSESLDETHNPAIESMAEQKEKSTENARAEKKKNNNTQDKEKLDINQKEQPKPKERKSNTKTTDKTEKKPRERKQSKPKIRDKQNIKTSRTNEKNIKTINSAQKKIKQSVREVANSKNTIKTAEHSAKTMKATQKNSKAAKKTAEIAAKTAKKTEEAARATAKASVKTIKVAAKATVAVVKATAASVKELVAAIAAGGWIAVLVIVLICLVAAIGGTCFGIFLTNDESTGSQMTMTTAMSQITSEYYANLTVLKAGFTYDTFEVQSPTGDISINWKDALAIYAVKTTTSAESGSEVVTIDDKKLDILRTIVNDMNTCVGAVTPKVVAETTVTSDADGNSVKTTTYVTKKVLTVVITHLTIQQAAEKYNFTDEQKQQLLELTSVEYDSLWTELLNGTGQIILTNSTWKSVGQFSWPLESSNNITSQFGTRSDPFTGEIKTHGGVDIAAAEGTPVLAAADGTVTLSCWGDSYGYHVKIAHDSTYSTLYAHCSALLVSAGQAVQKGQIIAYVGSTGRSTGPHLHFEVIQNGVRVNPLSYFTQ